MVRALLLCSLCSFACAPREVVDLVDHALWTETTSDPFLDEKPVDADCEPQGFGHEAPVFEVETAACPWGNFSQPLQAEVFAGDEVRLIAWHLPLVSQDGGEGVLYVSLGAMEFEYRVDIPAEETVLRPMQLAPEAITVDEEVLFHVHNHGANSWRILELRAGPPGSFEPSP